MELNRALKVIFIFIATYVALYVLSIFTPLGDWGTFKGILMFNYTYYLIPIPGFFLMYFLPPWYNKYFETNTANSPFFPLAFLAISIPAYYVSLFWYYKNVADLSGITEFNFDFVNIFLSSAYLVFVLAGLGGWAARAFVDGAFGDSAEPAVNA
ncbi:hypothetical protein KJ891_05055 [Candidatus Micrarchaeota archaeon]|nr:hypothetical protein [Candidatus Micrarchaeota archaeon]